MTASYARGASDVPLLDETIGASLRRTVERFGEREALVVGHQGYRATYAELWSEVDRAARALIAHGVRTGDRVGIWAPNRHEWVVIQFATARIGAILVTINPAYKAGELRHALNQAGVSLLVMARGLRGTDYVALLDEVRAECPALREAIVLEDGWEAFLARGERVSAAEVVAREFALHPDDPINIQYTSGTTGAPKGATLSHRNILNNAYFSGRMLHYSEHDRVCVPVPFYHCFGMVLGVLACVTHGACIVVPSESFDPAAVLKAVEAERCTSLYGVPTMFIAELAVPPFERFDLSSLRTGIMAGAPCPVEVMKQVRSRMHMDEVAIACGMTETAPLSTQTAPDDPLDKRVRTVGRVHPHVEIKVVDPETGEIVPRGMPGEQCTRGYGVMLGYWNDPKATRRAIDERRLDAHRRPRGDGRRRLPEHRRPDQGHDHPRRREHLPARDRGVPARAARRRRRARHRHPQRPLRRGGDGLGQAAPGRLAHARRARDRLPRPDRVVQDPRALEARRRLPDDDHRQDPEVPAARARERLVTDDPERLAAALLEELVLAAAVLIATVVAPTVIVWAG